MIVAKIRQHRRKEREGREKTEKRNELVHAELKLIRKQSDPESECWGRTVESTHSNGHH